MLDVGWGQPMVDGTDEGWTLDGTAQRWEQLDVIPDVGWE